MCKCYKSIVRFCFFGSKKWPYFLSTAFVALLLMISTEAQNIYNQGEQRNYDAPQSVPSVRGQCNTWQWMCEDERECIASYDVCDGIMQCSDGSDERNCHNRFIHGNDAHAATGNPTTAHSVSTTAPPRPVKQQAAEEQKLPMEYLLGGMALFVVVAASIHIYLRRRKRRFASSAVRGFRKGESLVEDEDDLLISQMYT